MASIFDDKKLNQFDELTQLIEPFVFPINSNLNRFPKVTEITYEDVRNMQDGSSATSTLYLSTILDYVNKKMKLDIPFNVVSDDNFKKKFSMEIIEGTILNLEEGTMNGVITIKKEESVYNDKEIKEIMIGNCVSSAFSGIRKQKNAPASRIHELAETMGILSTLKDQRGFSDKVRVLREKIKEELETNRIRIRDVDLAIQYGRWINKFLSDGNMAALKNIALLRIMSHTDKAIYSIQEESL